MWTVELHFWVNIFHTKLFFFFFDMLQPSARGSFAGTLLKKVVQGKEVKFTNGQESCF